VRRLLAAALLAVVAAVFASQVAGAPPPKAREQALVLELYGLDSRLDAARRSLDSVDRTAAELGRERASLAARLHAASRTLRNAQRLLSAELRALYEDAQPDPLAVVLGSSSLQDALDGVDELARASSATESVVAQSRTARADVRLLARELAVRERELRRLRASAATQVATLEQARGERASFLAGLRRRDRIEVEQRARAADAAARAAEVRSTAARSAASIGARPPGARTIVIVSTGYSLSGTTASGLPVGYGVAAVDPSVIPLGTRMTIPGYGEAVAADTGSAIRGVRVDLWFPTRKQALAWGWQTLRVTLR
jgi:3D (Asp-Asp-Asp) domain-containing protein